MRDDSQVKKSVLNVPLNFKSEWMNFVRNRKKIEPYHYTSHSHFCFGQRQ
jgi:hypothetical protein